MTESRNAIAVLTWEPVAEIQANGGTGNWVTSAARVREYPYVVLVRNRRHPSSPSDTEHGAAFLVGRISGAHETTKTASNRYPRVFIEISEYALVSVSSAWSKSQNPVWYTDLDKLRIEENALNFQPMPHESTASSDPVSNDNILADIKRQVRLLFNVPRSTVEIIIRL
jgi:hypothetical protein